MNDLPYIKQNAGPKWLQEAQCVPSISMGREVEAGVSDYKELVRRLEEKYILGTPGHQAAQAIEKLSAEVERLKQELAALRQRPVEGPSLDGPVKEPCMFDSLGPGIYGLVCPCPKCSLR